MTNKKLIDLSHTIEEGMITYKGLPAPLICDFLSREESKNHYEEGTEFVIGQFNMCSNTGTYIDSPFHRYADGKDLSQLELQQLASVEGVKITVAESSQFVDIEQLQGVDVRGKAVLIETNWSRHWNTDQYFEGHTYVTEAAAIYLRDQGAVIVGIDTYNIDDTSGKTRPVHTTLLGADIPIVEHMCNLAEVPSSGFKFYAVPVKVKQFGTFPVRAFVEVG